MEWKTILDIVIAVLLLATIGYAITLNSRLSQLRKNRDDLARTIVNFNEATLRAESSIPKLRKAADEAGLSLQERVDKAQSLRDDLAFMIERADSMANRLESAVRQSRTEGNVNLSTVTSGTTGHRDSLGQPSTPSSLLSGGYSATSRPSTNTSTTNPYVAPNSAIPRGSATSTDIEDERSQAELELLRALQSMR